MAGWAPGKKLFAVYDVLWTNEVTINNLYPFDVAVKLEKKETGPKEDITYRVFFNDSKLSFF